MAVGPTPTRGGTLDLLMIDVPDLVRVAVVASISNSDHSSLWAIIWIGILSVVQYGICPGVTFVMLTILLRI